MLIEKIIDKIIYHFKPNLLIKNLMVISITIFILSLFLISTFLSN